MQGLDQFKLNDTKTFELETPKGDQRILLPTGKQVTDDAGEQVDELAPVTITVRRASSREAQLWQNKVKNKSIDDPNRIAKMSAESLEANAVNFLVFLVIGWSNFRLGDEELPCTPQNVRRILTDDSYIWIRQQIDRHAGGDAGFQGND